MSSNTLNTFGTTASNSAFSRLTYIDYDENDSRISVRQLLGSHFIRVRPEPVPTPQLVIASLACAKELGIRPIDCESDLFSSVFSGNQLVNGLDDPYATVYGCHCYGTWFGQLGDGRAMSLGEVRKVDGNGENDINQGVDTTTLELQLKGCGRSPFSRGFDGRAVLRSCIREFLGRIS